MSAVCRTLLIGALSVAGRTAEGQMAASPADSAIRVLLDRSAEAWNGGDLDGHLADNADSITFMTKNGPVVGRDKAADVLRRAFFRDGRPVQSLRFEQITIRLLGSDHALVVGRFILYGGDQPEGGGWFTTVWQKTAQGWRTIHDHSG
jgi:ketosteroid isomerase-like protein